MSRPRWARRSTSFGSLALVLVLTGGVLSGCPLPPETAVSVDLERYEGLWYQVAGYPFFPSRNLVGVTAEYTIQQDGTVRVVNRGFEGGFDGPEEVIEGIARVVDPATNAKLEVTFPSVLGGLLKGEYWIIALDEVDYSYAVVSDSRRATLFVLSRTPVMAPGVLDALIEDLAARGYNRDRIVDFPQLEACGGANSDREVLRCALGNCLREMLLCMLEPACRAALECNSGCGSAGAQAEQQACNLVCQLAVGLRSERYSALVQCFAENGCLPSLPEGTDGRCLVTGENIHNVYVLESLAELEGTWRETRGLNCGVCGSGWEGGYDALPCRTSSWVYNAEQWWYHTSFCAPAGDGSCGEAGPVYLIAEPRISGEIPGLVEVHYVNPPLKPQEERWYILSKPHPDWIMYNYCGSTPAGAYAGVNVMTRAPEACDSAMPPEVDAAFRQAATDFNFSYDDMCVTEQTQCPPVTVEEDVQDWVDGL